MSVGVMKDYKLKLRKTPAPQWHNAALSPLFWKPLLFILNRENESYRHDLTYTGLHDKTNYKYPKILDFPSSHNKIHDTQIPVFVQTNLRLVRIFTAKGHKNWCSSQTLLVETCKKGHKS